MPQLFCTLMLLAGFGSFSAPRAQVMETSYLDSLHEFRSNFESQLQRMPGLEQAALAYFLPDSAFKVRASFTKAENPEPFMMGSLNGERESFVAYGTFMFVVNGQHGQLTAYRNLDRLRLPGGRDILLLPFRDATNGEQTYGGGRYLDLSIAQIRNGNATLDFNKAYFPICAHGGDYACPLPPANNTLSWPVLAGERHLDGQ